MRKRLIQTVIWLLMICLMLPLLFACKDQQGDEATTDSGADAVVNMIPIIQNKKSDYVIVHSSSDTIGKTVADELCSLLYKQYGVSLVIRSDKETYEHEIVVGATNRAVSAEAEKKLAGAGDFFIGFINGSLVLYAKEAAAMKRMMITLRDDYCKEKGDTFAIAENESYLYSEHLSEEDALGTAVELLKKGKTKYSIIVNEDNLDVERVARYVQSALQLQGATIKIYEDFEDYADNKDLEFIIGFPGIDRPELQSVASKVTGSDNFLLTCVGTKVVLLATDAGALIKGAEYFVTQCLSGVQDGNLTLREIDEYNYALSDRSYTIAAARLKELYTTVLKRYPTLYDWYYRAGTVSNDSKRDQQLIEAMIKRMENAAVFCIGSSSVLFDGMIRKLDPESYDRVTTLINGEVYIPVAFANSYFGTTFQTGGYRVVSLNALAKKTNSEVFCDTETGLVILTPPGVTSFADPAVNVKGYTNLAYRERMLKFFQSTEMPDPSNNTEQSRVVLEAPAGYFPEDSYDYTTVTYQVCYSPTILTVPQADGSNLIYAAYEISTIKEGAELGTVTVVRTSADGGETWQEYVRITSLRWAELFCLNDTIYLIGSDINAKCLSIYRINADKTVTAKSLTYRSSGIMQILIANGILYVPTDHGMFSVPVTADLMNTSNWTSTNDPNEMVGREWFKNITGLSLGSVGSGLGGCELMEANALVGPDGAIYAIYRIETHPHANYAVIFKLSADRTTYEMLPNNGSLIKLPTTVSRFTIKYDEKTKLYICVSNLWTVKSCERARNVVGLSVSSDMINWTTVDTLLVDREMMNAEASCWAHAFQYPDFDFDGDDLVLLIREATGYTNTFHDGKYCTFYRVSDFRNLIPESK